MDTTKAITHVSLCAGYGGIDIGLKRAIPNLRTVAFSEIEGFACANLVAKMEAGLLDAAPIWTNLKTFPWAEFRGCVDILSGGYPCQPFSAAGKRLGTEDPRHLWPFIADGIRLMQPRVCFFENVEGHISLGLRAVIEELGSLGYKTTWGIFSAREVGAPHQRKRVFIIAHRKCARLEGWISGMQSESNGCGTPSNISESSNLLVNSINDDGSDACGVEHGETKQSIFSIPSGNGADSNNSGSREDQLPSELRTTGVEQSSRCSRLPSESTQVGKIAVWPSRPGEPQHEWEPPRVVGNAEHDGSHGTAASRSNEANAGSRSKEESQVVEQCQGASGLGSEIRSSLGDTAVQRLSERRCGAIHESRSVEELKRPDQIVGDAEGQRSSTQRAKHEGLGGELCSASASGERVVGDTDCGRQSSSIDTRSCSETIGRGEGNIEQTECRQAQPSLGGDANGSAGGLDYAELCISSDNRTDELRLLGNGVVPATATRAFLTLIEELNDHIVGFNQMIL